MIEVIITLVPYGIEEAGRKRIARLKISNITGNVDADEQRYDVECESDDKPVERTTIMHRRGRGAKSLVATALAALSQSEVHPRSS